MGAARRQEWNAASEALRELDEEDEEMGEGVQPEGEGEVEGEGEGEGEDELDDLMMDVDGGPGAAARLKEQQELGDQTGEPAKKRSRTLTTPHQTRVLNALLAKVSSTALTNPICSRLTPYLPHPLQTRFPSTETRQQVGQEIGMSARRVQIWFQNRRQSQKRARDREASEGVPPGTYTDQLNPNPTFPLAPGAQPTYSGQSHHGYAQQGQQFSSSTYGAHAHSQTHSYPLSTHAVSPYLRTDPYARYPPPGEPSSRAQIHQHRGGRVSRQGSIDSIASVASLHSQATRMSRDTDTLGPLPNERNRAWPISSNMGWPGPVSSPPMSPGSERGESVGGTQLPSLFSVLNGQGGGQAEPQPSRTHAFSPGPADDFSRLAISHQDRPSSGAGGDMLDKAVAAINVPRAAPIKESLPPLRMALGPVVFDSPAPLPPRGEADKALLAPILARADSAASATPSSRTTATRLPSLASITTTFAPHPSIFPSHSHSSASTITQTHHFADNQPPTLQHSPNGPTSDSSPASHSPVTTPQSPFAHRASTWSTASAAPTAYSFPASQHSGPGTQGGRSSISSLDTLGTWARGADARDGVPGWSGSNSNGSGSNGNATGHGQAIANGHVFAATGKENGHGGSSRTSFSSEVQEEWERYNAGRKASGGGLGMEGREVRL